MVISQRALEDELFEYPERGNLLDDFGTARSIWTSKRAGPIRAHAVILSGVAYTVTKCVRSARAADVGTARPIYGGL